MSNSGCNDGPAGVSAFENVYKGAHVVEWLYASPRSQRFALLRRNRVTVPWDRRLWPISEGSLSGLVLIWGTDRRVLTLDALRSQVLVVPKRRQKLNRALSNHMGMDLSHVDVGRSVLRRGGAAPDALPNAALNDLGALDLGLELERKAAFELFDAVKRAKVEKAVLSSFVVALKRNPTIVQRVRASTLARRAGQHGLVVELTAPSEWASSKPPARFAAQLWLVRALAFLALGDEIEAERAAAKAYAINKKKGWMDLRALGAVSTFYGALRTAREE